MLDIMAFLLGCLEECTMLIREHLASPRLAFLRLDIDSQLHEVYSNEQVEGNGVVQLLGIGIGLLGQGPGQLLREPEEVLARTFR